MDDKDGPGFRKEARPVRVLSRYRQFIDAKLFCLWATKLADATRDTHRVLVSTIRHWMKNWRHNVTVTGILNYEESVPQR